MKVCVFSSPRTGSMLLSNLLATQFGLDNYREMFAYGERIYEMDYHRLMKLVDGNNYVVKITPTSFHHDTILQPEIFPWLTFDKIIILNRKNVVHQVASWAVLDYVQRCGAYNVNEQIPRVLQDVTQIRSSLNLLRYSLRCINDFYKTKKLIQSQNVPILSLNYEELNTNLKQYIFKLNSFFQTQFTQEHIVNASVNFLNVNYNEFIKYKQLDLKCRSVIDEDGLSYLQEEINLGNIIC
jgi:hypothetical protein